ncbi:hypothetical protein E4U21_006163 [Claviceps maximensis]|nr:hypothetical protein E4U21_006163 [Claviceps maximensis]
MVLDSQGTIFGDQKLFYCYILAAFFPTSTFLDSTKWGLGTRAIASVLPNQLSLSVEKIELELVDGVQRDVMTYQAYHSGQELLKHPPQSVNVFW